VQVAAATDTERGERIPIAWSSLFLDLAMNPLPSKVSRLMAQQRPERALGRQGHGEAAISRFPYGLRGRGILMAATQAVRFSSAFDPKSSCGDRQWKATSGSTAGLESRRRPRIETRPLNAPIPTGDRPKDPEARRTIRPGMLFCCRERRKKDDFSSAKSARVAS